MSNRKDESRSLLSPNQTRYSNFIKDTNCSTPIKIPPTTENQFDMHLSAIHQNSTDIFIESSSPSGVSEIMKVVGDDWLKNLSMESNVTEKNISSITEEQVIENSDNIIKNGEKSCDHIVNFSYQNNMESNIIGKSNSKEDNDTTADNKCEDSSNYVPSSSITTINETNSNVNDKLNFSINNNAPSVDIRDIYVPVSQSKDHLLKRMLK